MTANQAAQDPSERPMGALAPLKLATLPVYAGLLAYIGPGILWAALAQGSGELIWWPYMTAKYGAAFLGLLILASLLQYWLNLEICRYTIVTGETPMTGFTRIGRWFAWLAWILVFVENIWFGAYASAGGTALAALTGFPDGWTPRGQSLFWGYLMIAIYLFALVFSRVAYTMVEKFSMVVVAITMSGIIFAVFQEPVLATAGPFFTRADSALHRAEPGAQLGPEGLEHAGHLHRVRRRRRLRPAVLRLLDARQGRGHGQDRRPRHLPDHRRRPRPFPRPVSTSPTPRRTSATTRAGCATSASRTAWAWA